MNQNDRAQNYLDYLYDLDFTARPVDIREFIRNPLYLGGAPDGTHQGNDVYAVWKDSLEDIFLDDRRYLAVLTGAIGIGKTYTACIGIAYVMYLLLLLRDPWQYHELGSSGKMAIAFFNLTKSLGSSRAYIQLQTFLCSSPWFCERGRMRNTKEPELEFSLFEYILASPEAKGFGTIGAHIICAIMDEVNDPKASAKTRAKILQAYNSTVTRFASRFVKDQRALGRFFLVSSKQEELSFLDTFIADMKGSGRMTVVDIPIWEAKGDANYCGDKFAVMIGDAYADPKIIDDAKELREVQAKGREVILVPVEFRPEFDFDIVVALRDLAGVSSESSRKSKLFPAVNLINDCFHPDKEDPVSRITIPMGVKDSIQIQQFVDLDKIRMPKHIARFIHMDIAFASGGDCLGLAMCGVREWRTIDQMDAGTGQFFRRKVPVIETDFVLRLKAKEGDSIPTFKVRKFVMYLRQQGYNIRCFSADLKLASNDTLQIFEDCGVISEYISVDRKIQPYIEFRDLVFERRWICHRQPFLFFELKNLEYDTEKQKIDHPDKTIEKIVGNDGTVIESVLDGSKDLSDAVVGSVSQAIKHSQMPADAAVLSDLINRTKTVKPINPNEVDTAWWLDAISNTKKPVADAKKPLEHNENPDLQAFKGLIRKVNRRL